ALGSEEAGNSTFRKKTWYSEPRCDTVNTYVLSCAANSSCRKHALARAQLTACSRSLACSARALDASTNRRAESVPLCSAKPMALKAMRARNVSTIEKPASAELRFRLSSRRVRKEREAPARISIPMGVRPSIPTEVRPTNTHPPLRRFITGRSEEHTSELQSRENLVCRLLLEKKKKQIN